MEHNGANQTETFGTERVSTDPHRQWTAAEKLAIVEESYSTSRTVLATARLHGISNATLFRWRKACRDGRLGGVQPSGFVPAQVVADASCPAAFGISGRMEIVSSNGRRVVVGDDFAGPALSRLLDVLEARR